LFICGGAFIGLDKIIQKRNGQKVMGFGSPTLEVEEGLRKQSIRYVEPEDLLAFGMIPEFIGRLPVVAALDALTEEEMVAILTETKNAMLKQYTKLFSMENVRLSVTKDALKALAAQAVTKGTGARALRSMLERIMLDIMYDVPSREDIAEVTINRAEIVFVTGGLCPTSDDITRELVSDFLNLELLENSRVRETISRRLALRRIPATKRIWRQALVPRGGQVLPNENGTAPGIYISANISPKIPSPHLFRLLSERKQNVAIAESCTGGFLANEITNVSGASKAFVAGYVTYSNEEKIRTLGVSRESIGKFGAVSEQVATEMAQGIRERAG